MFVDVRCGHVGVAVDWHEEPVRIELEQRREAELDLEGTLSDGSVSFGMRVTALAFSKAS